MKQHVTNTLLRSAIATGLLALAACAPAPIYKPSPTTVATTPNIVAQSPGQYANADVIWGGQVVEVRNLADHSEVEIVGYPLDSSQRPKLASNGGWGRFIAVMPGYVEPFDYPDRLVDHLGGPHHQHPRRQGGRSQLRVPTGERRPIAPVDTR
ncbi:Slp family lipoprotein [Dyella terrae]|nr:Slp family lipoprotein [Dyella terrae]